MTHNFVKPEVIAQAGAIAIEKALTIPAVFQREGIDQYKGARDDTINVKVDGVLPFRTYGWRNDRSAPIQFDEYSEKTVSFSWGDDIYSAINLTDEQAEFDTNGWIKLATKQTEAVGRGLNYKAADYLLNTDYEYTVGVHESKLRGGLIEARRVLNKLGAPGNVRTLLVSSDWESALLNDEKLSLAKNVGEAEAVSQLRQATLGQRYGFNIVVADELPEDTAIALVESAFIFATGAPGVPQSVKFGALASHEGIAIRWIRDYDNVYQQERSVFRAYQGFRHVEDELVGRDATTGQAFTSEYSHFVRAIKLELNGESNYPVVSGGTSDAAKKATEIAKLSGLVAKPELAEPASPGETPGTEGD